MIRIPSSEIDPQGERRKMEDQARVLIQALNDFILGEDNAHMTLLSLKMFGKSLASYERDFEAKPGGESAEKKLLEKLAERAHSSWSHWMNYLFSKSSKQSDGSIVIPATLVERWQRQMNTPYSLLSEQEKQSDRNQAEAILPLIDQAVNG